MDGQRWLVRSPADLGRAISDIRTLSHHTQKTLSDLSGVERSYLAKLEAGASVLMLERALRILRRLGADVTVTWAQGPLPPVDGGCDGVT